jgi:DNA-binding IclR family transcriptional regulator
MTSASNIRVLERAVSVLSVLALNKRDMGVTEIALATDLSKATVHRILGTLEDHHVIIRLENGRYRIGPAPLLWADAYTAQLDLVEVARSALREIWEQTRETVHLAVYEQNEAYYLDKLESPHPVRMHSRIGASLRLYSSAAGRAILAFLPEHEQKSYFRKNTIEALTPNTAVNMGDILDRLARVRREGGSEENQENEEGIRCIGAPILDCRSYPLGAISISAPAYRFDDQTARKAAGKVREAAWTVSRKLGCSLEIPQLPTGE